jgi:flagellar protein FliS
MRPKPYQNCVEEEVLAANPLKLVELLYRGALDSIASARRYLSLGEIRARSRAINKTMEILAELARSLNHEAGGEVSRNLADLYAYMQTLLIEANTRQSDPPLAEAEKLLATLLEAWCSTANVAGGDSSRQSGLVSNGADHQPLSCTY